jgi:transcriptional regulator with XRE-family HTH domain
MAMADISKRLRHFFKRSGLTREAFAKKAGVSVSAISLWLSGKASPKYERLPRLVKVLKTDLPTFWGPLKDDEPEAGGAAPDEGSEVKAAAV